MHAQHRDQLLANGMKYAGIPGIIEGYKPLGGGSISEVYQLMTSKGVLVVKVSNRAEAKRMFKYEERGLSLLKDHTQMRIPQVKGRAEVGGAFMIFMEYIQQSARRADYWQCLGHGLAGLHCNSHSHFGLDYDNFIGSLPQSNHPSVSWVEFFIQERLEPMIRRATSSHLLSPEDVKHFDKLFARLKEWFPDEPPALIHGDLWSGNLIADDEGGPCLIDPAVYYGHREMEIAFTRLFGGFDSAFYKSYQEVFPLEPGFDRRMDLYNLYPLLVHLNLFGLGYKGSVMSILQKFTG